MPPRSQDTICLTACPKHRSQYSWTISYSPLSHRGTWAMCHGESGPGRRGGGLCEQDLRWEDAEGPGSTGRMSASVPGCAFAYLVCVPPTTHVCLWASMYVCA